MAQTGERNQATHSIGLLLALSSWLLIFVTLVWGYVVYRMRSSQWLGPYLDSDVMMISIVNTLVMALSSWTLGRGIATRKRALVLYSLILGVVFAAGQWWVWNKLLHDGLHWQESVAGSFFFLLTGFHAMHIIVGLVFLGLVAATLNVGAKDNFNRGVRYFWDSLWWVWVVLWVLIFIIR